jgi:hypothetical protein
MPAITIRNIPESVHAGLKRRAATSKLSVEELLRRLLSSWVDTSADPMQTETETLKPKPPYPDLWGAMKGTVHIPPDTDLTAPLDEAWKALG